MKILLISSRFYPQIGGVENVVRNLAEGLSHNNNVCVLISKHLPLEIKKLLKVSEDESSFEEYSVKRIWMGLPNSLLGILFFPLRFVLAMKELIQFIRKYNPNIIHYHFPDHSGIYVLILSYLIKKPLIINIHGNDLQLFAKKLFYNRVLKRLLKRASLVIVNSTYMKEEVMRFDAILNSKTRIIANGINIEYFRKIKKSENFREPYFFCVGRLVYKKGIDLLIDAFGLIIKQGRNVKLIIEGDGEEMPKIKAQLKSASLLDHVRLTEGKLSNEEKISIAKGSVCAVIPSRIEPFGIVALEFMASGVPIIASKTGGFQDLLKNDYSCLFFENGNVSDLSKKMLQMLDNKDLIEQLSKNAEKEVQKYDWSNIVKKYQDEYRNLL